MPRLLPHEQVHGQRAQFRHVFADVVAEEGARVVGSGDAVGGVGDAAEGVDDGVLEERDLQEVGHFPEFDEAEVGGVGA